MGCRRWSISGGEPMLRPDFADIFDELFGQFGFSTGRRSRQTPRRGRDLVARLLKSAELQALVAEGLGRAGLALGSRQDHRVA